MTLAGGYASMDGVAGVLAAVCSKGAQVWCENGELRYRARKGVLTPEDVAMLHGSRNEILAFAQRLGGHIEPTLRPRARTGPVPLTYSQLARWQGGQLLTRSSIRHLASVTRLHGKLDISALQRSFDEVVGRHEALRTRIVAINSEPFQEIDESGDCALRLDDLTRTACSARDSEVRRLIDESILEPVRTDIGPLLTVRLIKTGEDEHVLIIAKEHLIGDGYSLSLLLNEVLAIYRRTVSGGGPALPAIALQFGDYAVWQRLKEPLWSKLHEADWRELERCSPLVFPGGEQHQRSDRSGWGTLHLRIGRELKMQLCEWCRENQTTLVMSVFTAYVATLLRWCGASAGVIRYETDGRPSPQLENTIGFFAAPIYLRVSIAAADSFIDLLKRTTEEYCRAHERADFLYLEARAPESPIVKSPFFNWIPRASGSAAAASDDPGQPLRCSTIAFDNPMFKDSEMDMEPALLVFDGAEDITADLIFPSYRFSAETMARFGRNFLGFVKGLLEAPMQCVPRVMVD